jgi:tRNA1(Val) A37 N6-methylase TrmN6
LNAEKNKISDRVTALHIDQISKIPEDMKFDLVVGNPPHQHNWSYTVEYLQRIMVDEDWKIHKEFFTNIRRFLNKNAEIILSETDSFPEHIEMAESNGLKFVEYIKAPVTMTGNAPSARLMIYESV